MITDNAEYACGGDSLVVGFRNGVHVKRGPDEPVCGPVGTRQEGGAPDVFPVFVQRELLVEYPVNWS